MSTSVTPRMILIGTIYGILAPCCFDIVEGDEKETKESPVWDYATKIKSRGQKKKIKKKNLTRKKGIWSVDAFIRWNPNPWLLHLPLSIESGIMVLNTHTHIHTYHTYIHTYIHVTNTWHTCISWFLHIHIWYTYIHICHKYISSMHTLHMYIHVIHPYKFIIHTCHKYIA